MLRKTVAVVAAVAALATLPLQIAARLAVTPVEAVVATPPMGYNDWNAFGCDVDDRLIRETADAMVANGMVAAGYEYVNIDDCWSLPERRDGRLVADPAKFPDGIKPLADYLHRRGLKLGIYGDAGTLTCAGYPGSLGHEQVDADTWASWGVDYLKYDNCHNSSDGSRADFVRRYTAMSSALRLSGRPIVLSLCEWGQSQPWTWASGVGQLWRTTGDIADTWDSLRSIIAQNAPLSRYAGPGAFNDPDMLEVGNGGMTDTEYRTHMIMWAMMAAPLIAGADLRALTPSTLALLTDPGLIAIDQDRLGLQATVLSDTGGRLVLDKPLSDGDHAIAFYNPTDTAASMGVRLTATGLAAAPGYRIRDLTTAAESPATPTLEATVPPHGTAVFRITPLKGPT
ncbi:glycoside hydrolase family 27 protein [Actinoplanes sp. NPDC051851]|uniref:glycoside hydrolase family 27 protein n=1 Tax=Actinoplanes sp. NPDC051851 TaxID=3154753 RepID=UPI003446A96D